MLACAAFIGCSSSSNSAPDKFVGNWTFSSGSLNATCTGLPPFTNDLTGQTLTLTKGMSSDLVSTLTSSLGTCTLKLSVSGTVASAEPAQSCSFNVPVAGTSIAVTVNINTWTVTTTDGMSMTTAATATGSGGLADGCPVTLNGTGTKHGDGG